MGNRNRTTMGVADKIFEIIDLNSNGSLSQKEVMGFIYFMFKGCEDDNEREAAKHFSKKIISVADSNGLGSDGEITKEMLENANEPEDIPESTQKGMEQIMAGMEAMGEDGIREVLKKVAELSDEEMQSY